MIVNRKELNWSAPYVYTFRHLLIWQVTPFLQCVINGLKRQKACIVLEQDKHIQIHCHHWLKIKRGTHRTSDGVILDHTFCDKLDKHFQCFFHLSDLFSFKC